MRRTLVVVAILAFGKVLAQESPLKPEELAKMSLEEMQKKADEYIREMNEMVSDVLKMLQSAQDSKDFQGIQCLNQVVGSLKGLVKLSEQNRIGLRQAVISQDRASATHEFVKIAIGRDRVRELHSQAKGCGGPGAELVLEGQPVVERKFEAGLPLYEVRAGLETPEVPLEPVPSASPFY